MFRLKIVIISLLLVIVSRCCIAQESKSTAGSDSATINEAVLVKEEQQKRIDSLVKQQLTKELAAGFLKRCYEHCGGTGHYIYAAFPDWRPCKDRRSNR